MRGRAHIVRVVTRMLPYTFPMALDVGRLLAAAATAQARGEKRSHRRFGTIGRKQLETWPLRWVSVDEPQAVYFPDAHHTGTVATVLLTMMGVVAFVLLIFTVVSVSEKDWPFVAIFAPAAIGVGGGAVYLEARRTRRRRERESGVEEHGLYLTRDTVVVHQGRRVVTIRRAQIRRFAARNTARPGGATARYREYIEVDVDGRTSHVDLQHRTDEDQRRLCNEWLSGTWPLSLPAPPPSSE
jgi:hypothetical protein